MFQKKRDHALCLRDWETLIWNTRMIPHPYTGWFTEHDTRACQSHEESFEAAFLVMWLSVRPGRSTQFNRCLQGQFHGDSPEHDMARRTTEWVGERQHFFIKTTTRFCAESHFCLNGEGGYQLKMTVHCGITGFLDWPVSKTNMYQH